MCVCVRADGRTVRDAAYIPKRGGRGQGSKPQLTPHPALCLGTYTDPELMQRQEWQGSAGVGGCLCL